jgi:hypothetical protein
MALDAIFALDRRGKSVCFEVALICCRQNLKTAIFKMAVLGWLYLTKERLVVWSAHEFRTSEEAFRDLEALLTGEHYFRREIRRIYRGNGDESIEMRNGARLIFKARTKGGGRGLSGSKVILARGTRSSRCTWARCCQPCRRSRTRKCCTGQAPGTPTRKCSAVCGTVAGKAATRASGTSNGARTCPRSPARPVTTARTPRRRSGAAVTTRASG